MKNTGTTRIVFPLLLTCDKLKCVRPQAEEVVARSNKECHEWECAHEDGSNMEGSSEAARNELARVCAAPFHPHSFRNEAFALSYGRPIAGSVRGEQSARESLKA